MLGNSQSARSKSGRVANILGMKTPLMLLFTSDNESEDSVAEALLICDRLGEGLYRPHIEQALAETCA